MRAAETNRSAKQAPIDGESENTRGTGTRSGSKSRSRTRETAMTRKVASAQAGAGQPAAPRRGLLVGGLAGGIVVALGAGLGIGWAVFKPKKATLIIRSKPKGARVIVDGKKTGEVTPHILRPEVGSALKVVVEKKGYAPVAEVVQIKSAKAVELELELEKE